MAQAVTLYHNPRCSKCRETLNLLKEQGVEPDIVHYLETPPAKAELKDLLQKLGMGPRELLRTSEKAYKEQGLSDPSLSDDTLLEAMQAEPRLIQRPIVVAGNKAVLGRPPENVLNLL